LTYKFSLDSSSNIQIQKDLESFEIYKKQIKNIELDLKLNHNINQAAASQEEELETKRNESEKIKMENHRRLNLITEKSGKLGEFLSEKGLKFNLVNKLFANKLKNIEKIYDASKLNLEKDFMKESENFHLTIQENKNLMFFLNLKIKDKKLSIGFYQSIALTQKDFKSYKFHKDKNSFLMFSGNKFILANEKADAQFFFLDNYFFIVGFNNGGGLYLRDKSLRLNLTKISNQFVLTEADFESLEELNQKNLYEHLTNLQVFKINSDLEN